MKITHISSRDNALLARLRKLARRPTGYRQDGQALLEGKNLCEAWAGHGAGPAQHALVSEPAWRSGELAQLANTALAIAVVAEAAMADLGMLATPVPIAFVIDLPATPEIAAAMPTVVLDRVQDPGNVGSILRSASAFGFSQIIAIRGTAALWSGKVLRAGMGAHFGLRLVEGAEAVDLERLAIPLLTTSSHASAALPDLALEWPCAWVFGNEGEGVATALLDRCQAQARIPQPGGGESLNVAAAAAVCLYESMRRLS
ncbi:MAG: RNA methyltransferase [Pseudomonadota bacterium]|nr:RNA methyltransferase [Pseudomonadota bacterium]